ncbi:hypothetical protein OGAPHI_004057 [Ogataea philodendri]|uniref:Uncharacterized protein n=1 Tax=Ogataea philodendri TaxID=1378263 RepID=A0A9P8T4E4_9ASCO|nr:uncharacterized protein OGAPHI_004057 [Ogataea philodendri]KAH3665868.1 hypothetical protein OGAPHI_004057 [Ogataea philodendri]
MPGLSNLSLVDGDVSGEVLPVAIEMIDEPDSEALLREEVTIGAGTLFLSFLVSFPKGLGKLSKGEASPLNTFSSELRLLTLVGDGLEEYSWATSAEFTVLTDKDLLLKKSAWKC